MNRVRKELETYPESKVYLSTPPVIPGLGTAGGFEMQLEARGDATYDDFGTSYRHLNVLRFST